MPEWPRGLAFLFHTLMLSVFSETWKLCRNHEHLSSAVLCQGKSRKWFYNHPESKHGLRASEGSRSVKLRSALFFFLLFFLKPPILPQLLCVLEHKSAPTSQLAARRVPRVCARKRDASAEIIGYATTAQQEVKNARRRKRGRKAGRRGAC